MLAKSSVTISAKLFELALMLVRFDHVASGIVNANHNIV